MPEPLILADPDLRTPPDRPFWTTEEMVDDRRKWPLYSVAEVSKIFFGRSANWLRLHLRDGSNVSDELGVVDCPRSAAGARQFRLYDIERLAHAFAHNGVVSAQELELTIIMVKAQAKIHHFIG